jgi:hypothetical protein
MYNYYYVGPILNHINTDTREYFISKQESYVYKYIMMQNYNDILTNVFSVYRNPFIHKISYSDMKEYNIDFRKIKLINDDILINMYDNLMYAINSKYYDKRTEYREMITRELGKLEIKYIEKIEFINKIIEK